MYNILVADDDKEIVESIEIYLNNEGYKVFKAYDGLEALDILMREDIHLILMDIMMPKLDGIKATIKIRQEKNIPIILVSAKGEDTDKILGLNIGADDYIIKPFDTEVFLYKVKAAIRRSNNLTKKPEIIMIGKYEFNPVSRRISFYGKEQKLSPKEAALLQLLCEHQNEVLPREKALKIIWGDDNYFTARSMDVFITKLRKYLKDDKNIAIENIHSSGYRLIVGGNIK